MTDKQRHIIKEWEKTRVVHPSYGEIALKVNSPKSYVFRTVKKHLADKKAKSK